jgi:iron complex outermembrane receptor protein
MPTPPVQEKDLSAPSWTFSLQYQINPDNMVYFSQRGSFRSGNFNGAVVPYGNLNYFGNEYTHDFEIGYKFNGHLGQTPAHFNIALYQQNVENAQHAVYALVGGNPAGFTVNVPRKRIRGVEADGDIRPAHWLKLGFAGAFTNAEYTSNIVDLSMQTGIANYKIPFDSYPDTPKWTGSFYADVTLPVPKSLGEMTLHADSFSQTSTFFSSNYGTITPRTKLPGYTTANVRLSWNEMMGSKVSLGVYVKNVFDKFYYQSGYVEGASGGFNTAIPGEPRTFGAELSVKF